MLKRLITPASGRFKYRYDMYTEKHNIIELHAAPNTQPGGVHGALLSSRYQLPVGPVPIK
jgi:hypothetical protein